MAQKLAFSRIGIQSEDKKGGFLKLVIGDAFWDKNEDGRYPNEETCHKDPIPIVFGKGHLTVREILLLEIQKEDGCLTSFEVGSEPRRF